MIAAKLGKMITAGTVMLFMAGCASPSTSLSSADNASENQARGSSYQNSELAAFMVGQFALKNGDLAVAADAFTIALAQNQDNPYLLNLAFQTQYFSGDIEAASDLAARIERSDDHIMLSSEPAAGTGGNGTGLGSIICSGQTHGRRWPVASYRNNYGGMGAGRSRSG
jgi:hypothetical protein